MSFSVEATVFRDLAKVELFELNEAGNVMDGRTWYVNIYIGGVDLDADEIELPEEEMEYCLAELVRQRDITVDKESETGDLSQAVGDWLLPRLSE